MREGDVRAERPRAVLDLLARAATALAGAALVGLVLVQGWQVFARYVLNDSPSWTEPVAIVLLTTAMMFGAAVGVRRDAHFGFFIAVEMAPPAVARALRIFARLVVAAIGLMLAVWGGQLLADGWDVKLPGAALPQSIVFLPLCVGGALIVLFAIERMLAPAPAAPGD